VVLCGCATDLTWRRREGLDYFVGKQSEALTAALGPPTKSWTTGGVVYLAYRYQGDEWLPGEPAERNPYTNQPEGPGVISTNCTTTFRVTVGKISAWSLNGNACREPPYPPVQPYSMHMERIAAGRGVRSATSFPDDESTGHSVVRYGTFYSN
jgi:hypothetical protein